MVCGEFFITLKKMGLYNRYEYRKNRYLLFLNFLYTFSLEKNTFSNYRKNIWYLEKALKIENQKYIFNFGLCVRAVRTFMPLAQADDTAIAISRAGTVNKQGLFDGTSGVMSIKNLPHLGGV